MKSSLMSPEYAVRKSDFLSRLYDSEATDGEFEQPGFPKVALVFFALAFAFVGCVMAAAFS